MYAVLKVWFFCSFFTLIWKTTQNDSLFDWKFQHWFYPYSLLAACIGLPFLFPYSLIAPHPLFFFILFFVAFPFYLLEMKCSNRLEIIVKYNKDYSCMVGYLSINIHHFLSMYNLSSTLLFKYLINI